MEWILANEEYITYEKVVRSTKNPTLAYTIDVCLKEPMVVVYGEFFTEMLAYVPGVRPERAFILGGMFADMAARGDFDEAAHRLRFHDTFDAI